MKKNSKKVRLTLFYKSTLIFLVIYLAGVIPMFAISLDDIPANQGPGTYPIEFSYIDENGNEHSQQINWTLTYPHTIISYENQEAIDARDLVINQNNDIELTEKDFIEKMNAVAWSIANGESVAIAKINIEQNKNNQNEYIITFMTEKGTQTKATLKWVTTDVLNLNEMYLYNNEDESIDRYNQLYLFVGVIILPVIYLIVIYIISFWQTRKVEKLLYK